MTRDPMFDRSPKTPKLKLDPEIEREINALPKKLKKTDIACSQRPPN